MSEALRQAVYAGQLIRRPGREEPLGAIAWAAVVDAFGAPLDGGPPIEATRFAPLRPAARNPLARPPIEEGLEVSLRPVNPRRAPVGTVPRIVREFRLLEQTLNLLGVQPSPRFHGALTRHHAGEGSERSP